MSKRKEREFFCPHCDAPLLIGKDKIVLGVNTIEDKKGIAIFNAELGNYDLETHKNTSAILKGSKNRRFNFSCPICLSDLLSRYEDFNKIKMRDFDGETKCVLFSRVYGQKCTVIISNKDGKIELFGPDANKYTKTFFRKEIKRTTSH